MRIEDVKPNYGANKPKRRLGRGPGSGLGKTSGRGGKGQTARSGASIRPGFEGGQTPLYRRIQKRGFVNKFAIDVVGINLRDLANKIDSDGVFYGEKWAKTNSVVKILGDGEVPANLKKVVRVLLSQNARAKLEAKGVAIEE